MVTLKHGGTLGPFKAANYKAGRAPDVRPTNVGASLNGSRRLSIPGQSRARIQSGPSPPSHTAKGGVLPPPTISWLSSAHSHPGLLTATAAPEMTWLPLNVVVVDNDRGASPNSYRARALGAGAQQVPPVTSWIHARWQPLPGTCY